MAAVPESWQPMRILHALDTSRSLGWPPENRDHRQMLAWCGRTCRHGWQMEQDGETIATFWFESPREAQEFALRWFPYKCV